MRNHLSVVFTAALAFSAVAGWAPAQTDPPRYVNVELVAVDPGRRVVVVKNSRGAQTTLQMDDLLAGAGGTKMGDRVTLTVRGGPGNWRVSAITRTSASPVKVSGAAIPQSTTPSSAGDSRAQAREAFSKQVATLSQDAQSIDGIWGSFVTSCDAKAASTHGGREWFGLWDGRVQADYSSGNCRDLFNQMVASGERIKHGMAAAEEGVRNTLTPGDIRDIRTLNRMDWDGWSLKPPARRDP